MVFEGLPAKVNFDRIPSTFFSELLPQIDHLVGVFGREMVTKVADRLIGGLDEQRTVFQPAPSKPLDDRSRLRITPEGILKTCLYDKGAVDLKKMLRDGNSNVEIIDAIRGAVQNRAVDGFESQKRANQLYNLSMAQIGG